MYHSFEELDVWKRACTLAVRFYEVLKECRDYGLKDQMQRAAVSIPSNIAEGAERGGRDFVRFISIARGSAAELRTQVYIARKVGIIEETIAMELVEELKHVSRMLTGLAKSVVPETPAQKPKN
ncbi:MAG: four helix bundle protein [Gallionella sp.]|nr:four helix bundle protein [Gallionella sp.]